MIKINNTVISGNSVSGDLDRSVVVNDGKVIVNGKMIEVSDKTINIYVQGDIQELKVDYCAQVFVEGNVDRLSTASAPVTVSKVTGSVSTASGGVTASDVAGDIRTVSGTVKCNTSNGSVKTVSGKISINTVTGNIKM